MAVGGWNGLAEGFAQGLQIGNQMSEQRSKRLALLQAQAQEKITQTTSYVNEGIKYLTTTVGAQPKRSPELENTVNAYKQHLLESANALKALPGGAEASQYLTQTLNTVIPNLKTQSEAHTAKVMGEYEGTMAAQDQLNSELTAPQQPMPAAAASPSPMPGAQPAPAQQVAQAASPAPTAAVPGVAQPPAPTGPGPINISRQDAFRKAAGLEQRDQESTTADKNMLTKAMSAANTIFSTLDEYEAVLKKYGKETGIPGTMGYQLAEPFRQGILLQTKDMYDLGALQKPDLEIMSKLLFDPTSIPALFGDFEARYKANGEALRSMVRKRLEGVQAGIARQPDPRLAAPEEAETALPPGQQMADEPGLMSGAQAEEQTFEPDEEGWVTLGPGIRMRAKQGAQ